MVISSWLRSYVRASRKYYCKEARQMLTGGTYRGNPSYSLYRFIVARNWVDVEVKHWHSLLRNSTRMSSLAPLKGNFVPFHDISGAYGDTLSGVGALSYSGSSAVGEPRRGRPSTSIDNRLSH